MRETIKLKAHVKPRCTCEDHYLELCQSFDGYAYTYRRCCTKCGKWWTDAYAECIQEYDETHLYSDNRFICVLKTPRIIQTEHTVIFDDGHGHRDVYLKYCDGTLSELLRRETY